MNRKVMFFLIALVGIGLYALPSTTALFAGQHSFVNIDATGNQIDCVKCHGDVNAELGGQGSTVTGTDGPHANFECSYCHRVEAGASTGDNAFALIKYEGDDLELRTLAIGVRDMEEQNYPKTILASATSVTGLTDTSSRRGPGFKLSPVETGLNDTQNATVMTVITYGGGVTLYSTYDAGEPVDTDPATRFNGLILNRATWEWTVPGHGDPYWGINLTGAGSEAVNPGSSYHAASLVSCMECHGGADHGPLGHYTRIGEDGNECSDCHYGPLDSHTYDWGEFDAGGFGLTVDPDTGDVVASDTGATEAHNEFVRQDDGITRYGGSSLMNDTSLYASNGACVACHTHAKVDITYTKPTTLAFEVDMTGTDFVEVLDNFSADGANVSHSSGV